MKVLFSQWMRELDLDAINKTGIPSIVLMENASRGTAQIIRDEFPVNKYSSLILFIGPGNNGGDGIAIGRILAQWGYDPLFLFLTDPEKLSGDPAVNFNIIKNLGLRYSEIHGSRELKDIIKSYSHTDTVFIDAIFGTGMKRAVTEGSYFEIINAINEAKFKIVSIDLPSGLSDFFPPSEGIMVEPDITTTFQVLKINHIFPDDRKRCGKIFVIDIGIPEKYIRDEKYFVELSDTSGFSGLLKKRESGVHKGKLGHGLVVAGSEDKPGAALLSAISVLRSGAGLSTCVASGKNRDLIMRSYPEIMTLKENVFSEMKVIPGEFDCILAGPGMGVNDQTKELVIKIISNSSIPVILDADALNVLTGRKDILEKKRSYPLVITPHPKEFSRITGTPISEILNDPVNSARNFSIKYELFTILKGHHTLIAAPDGRVVINQTGNPGMATAGSGDILGGIITGMISQFKNDFPVLTILQAAVFIHGYAGDIAASNKGESPMIASDIVQSISDAFKSINEYRSDFIFT